MTLVPIYELTKQQRHVLELLLAGKPAKAIARELELAVGTVRQHTNGIYKTLAIHSRAELLVKYRPPPRVNLELLALLTPAEQRVAMALGQGLPVKQIATALNSAIGTVRVHLTAVFRKLQVDSRAEVIVKLFPDRAVDDITGLPEYIGS